MGGSQATATQDTQAMSYYHRCIFTAAVCLAFGLGEVRGGLIITSLQGNGQLTWADPEQGSNALYRIEWASHVSGPWQRGWSGLEWLRMGATSGSVAVPMLFRVVRETSTTGIVGSWGSGRDGLKAFSTLTFYPDGHYIHWASGLTAAGGKPGIELGTYVYDAVGKVLKVSSLRDDNGEWGLTKGPEQAREEPAHLLGDILLLEAPGGGWMSLSRVQEPEIPLVGGWGDGRNRDRSGFMTITFYPNGYYIHWQSPDPGHPDTKEGVEYGMYDYDAAGKYLTAVALRDDNGTMGLCGDSDAAIGGGRYGFVLTIEGDVLAEFDAARVR